MTSRAIQTTDRTSNASGGGRSAPSRRAAVWALLAASLAFYLITLDNLVVTVALPAIGRGVGGGVQGQQWILSAYAVAFAAFLLLGGTTCDRLGAKRTMMLGTATFALASAALALAPGLGALIAGRAVEGFAAALMLPASMALIREAFPQPAARARAVGLWAIGGAIAMMTGASLGGLFAKADWRLAFAINIPFCLLGALILIGVRPSTTSFKRFDWLGQFFAVVTLGCLIFALVRGGPDGFMSPWVITSGGIAILGFAAFVTVERRVSAPMLPLEIFARKPMRVAFAFSFAFMLSWFGCIVVVNLYLQEELGMSPVDAGLVFLPSAFVSMVLNVLCGPLVNRVGVRAAAVVGLVPMLGGLSGLAAVAPRANLFWMAVMVVLIAGGGAIVSPVMTGLVLANATTSNSGVASGAFNSFRQMGGTVAVAGFGLLIAVPGRFTEGVQWSFAIAALSILATLIMTVVGLRPTLSAGRGGDTKR